MTVDHAPLLERAFGHLEEGELRVQRVEGEIPSGLDGTWFANGPGRFAVGPVRYLNWLDGDGAVSAVRVRGNEIEVQQRLVATAKLREEKEAGTALYRSFGTAFPGDRLVRGAAVASPVNVSVWPYAARLVAFGEQGLPYELAVDDLETQGTFTFGGAINAVTPFSGHPKIDPSTGELVTFGVSYAAQEAALQLFRFDAHGDLVLRARCPLPFPASIHDFALGPTTAVFHVGPYVLDVDSIRRSGRSVLEALAWQPERGSRLLVLERRTGARLAEVAIGQGYCLHLLNAWEERERLTVDLIELDRPIYRDYHELPELFTDVCPGRPVRYVLDLAAGRVLTRRASPFRGTPDFPVMDQRRLGEPTEDAWMLALSATGSPGRKFFDRLIHFDWRDSRILGEWRPRRGIYLGGEPAPVPTVGGTIVLIHLWDAGANRSGIAFFPAARLAEGPLAVAWLDGRMRLAFHGMFDS